MACRSASTPKLVLTVTSLLLFASLCIMYLQKVFQTVGPTPSVAPRNLTRMRGAVDASLYTQNDHLKKFKIPLLAKPNPVPSKCSAYLELTDVDFFHDSLRPLLCRDTPAFTIVNGKFPPCRLPSFVPLVSRLNAEKVHTDNVFGGPKFPVFGYAGDFLQEAVKSSNWESVGIRVTLSFAKKFEIGSVSLLDIGCNIGLYALNARLAGIPTLCVDANIRNLLRVQMALDNLGIPQDDKFKIYWSFFDNQVGVKRFKFLKTMCHIGAASPNFDNSIAFSDPVPVTTISGDDLIGQMMTEKVIIKADIEGFEPEYLKTAEVFFQLYDVIAVQMEMSPATLQPEFLRDFFGKRGFDLYTMSLVQVKNITRETIPFNGLWLKQNYAPMLKNIKA